MRVSGIKREGRRGKKKGAKITTSSAKILIPSQPTTYHSVIVY
jgi:hypothetical protein